MKKLIEAWEFGTKCLFDDGTISFYTFFTVILAQCCYLWANYEKQTALPLTLILLGYMLNVFVCAWFKGIWEGEKKEIVVTIVHNAIYIALFVIGCFINAKLTIIMTIILFGVTAVWIGADIGCYPCKNYSLGAWILIFIPFIAFFYYFTLVFGVSLVYIIGFPILFLVYCPLITFYEDEAGAHSVLGLMFEMTWSPELEQFHKSMK